MLAQQARSGSTGLTRKEFLGALGAAGLGGAVLGPDALLRPASAAAATPHIRPTDLSFSIAAQFRPFEIVADGFAAVEDGFDAGTGSYRTFAPLPEQDPGGTSVAGGALSLSGKTFFALLAASAGPVAPYAAVQVAVESFSGVRNATQETVYAGLVADAGNYVVAAYNRATQRVAVEVGNGGQRSQLIQATAALAAPVSFAFVLNENNVIALADTGGGFVPLVRANVASVLDLRDPSVLARYRYGFGARADAGTIVLD